MARRLYLTRQVVFLARLAVLAAACIAGSLTAGCGPPEAQGSPPPPAVTVNRPMREEVIEWDEYSGHLEAPDFVNVQARVSGQVVETPFDEGSIVQKDKVLFVIDERPFKADYEAKLADVAKAEAQTALADVQFKRADQLHKIKSISDQDYDNAVANLKQAQAVLLGAKAAAETSRLNLEWTRVVAPISGRVSRKSVTVGNLVTGGNSQATLLTTIESIDPMYCYIDVNEQAILKYQKLAREKKRVSARDARIPTFIALSNEVDFPHAGVVDFVDNKVDTSTGTLRGRGVFPNHDGYLTPGFFARVRLPGSGKYQALLIPDAAVGTDQDSNFVLVVKPDDMVEVRPVKLGALFGKLRSIEDGLSESDRVIVNGIQVARPGSKVAPTEMPIPSDLLRGITADLMAGSPATQSVPQTNPADTRPTTAPVAMGVAP